MNAKQLLMFVVLGAAVGASLLSGCTLQGPIYRDPDGWRQDRGDAAKTGWHLWLAPEPTGRVVWRRQVGAMIASSPAVAPDGTVYVGTEDTARALVAINPDGTERWAVPISGQKVRATPAIRSDGSLVVVSYAQVPCRPYNGKGLVSLVSRSGETLRVSQDFETSGLSAPMLDARDNAFVVSRVGSRDTLVKFDTSFVSTIVGGITYAITGSAGFWDTVCSVTVPTVLGPAPLAGLCGFQSTPVCPLEYLPPAPSPALVPGTTDEILIGSYESALIRIGGDHIWKRDIPALFTPAIRNDVAYLATSGKRIEAWDITGHRRWGMHFSGFPVAPAAVGHARNAASFYPDFLYVAAVNRTTADDEYVWLYMVNFNTGQITQKPLGGTFAGAPAVLSMWGGDEIVVVTSHNNLLWAFRQDGTYLWSIPLDSRALGSPAIVSGRIYVATETSIFAIE